MDKKLSKSVERKQFEKKKNISHTKTDHDLEKKLLKIPSLDDNDTHSSFSEVSEENESPPSDHTKSIQIQKCKKTYGSHSVKDGCQYTGDKTPKTVKHISGNVISNSAKLCSEKNSFLSQFDESKRYTTNDLACLLSSGFRSICTQLNN